MTAKNVTNTTDSPLGLPTGQIIQSKTTVLIKDWEKIDSNEVVKAWLDAEALTVEDADNGEDATDETAETDVANVNSQTGDNSGTAQTTDVGAGGIPASPAPAAPAAPVVAFVAKTDDELAAMNNGERAAYIEKELGGTVKSGSTKDDLTTQIKELEAAKLAANPAPAQN